METLGLESEEAIQRKLTESLKYNSLMFFFSFNFSYHQLLYVPEVVMG